MIRPTIVEASVAVLLYEIVAIWFKWPTWTARSHSKSGLPIWIYVAWLIVHLFRGDTTPGRTH